MVCDIIEKQYQASKYSIVITLLRRRNHTHLTCASKDHWERKRHALPDARAEQMNVETKCIIEN